MNYAAFRKVSAIQATRKTIVVPEFSYPSVWSGVSSMLAQFPVQNTNPFTFRRPVEQPNETFVAAVRWSVAPYVYRYKFADLGVLYFPVYDGERIGANAYIEIWDVSGESLAYTEDDWIITCSKLSLPNLCMCTSTAESVILAAVVPSVLPAYHYCNPLCTPLCT